MLSSTVFSRVTLIVASLCVVFQISSSLTLDPWGKSVSLADQRTNDEDSVPVLKEALREAAERQLEDLQALEQYLDLQISELQRKKMDVQMKKRGHFACRVHAIACYKKRSAKA